MPVIAACWQCATAASCPVVRRGCRKVSKVCPTHRKQHVARSQPHRCRRRLPRRSPLQRRGGRRFRPAVAVLGRHHRRFRIEVHLINFIDTLHRTRRGEGEVSGALCPMKCGGRRAGGIRTGARACQGPLARRKGKRERAESSARRRFERRTRLPGNAEPGRAGCAEAAEPGPSLRRAPDVRDVLPGQTDRRTWRRPTNTSSGEDAKLVTAAAWARPPAPSLGAHPLGVKSITITVVSSRNPRREIATSTSSVHASSVLSSRREVTA